MGNTFEFPLEADLILRIQELIAQWPFLKGLFIILTQFGEPVFAVAAIALLYWGYKKEWGMHTLLCVMGTQIINGMIKNSFLRLRPYMVSESIKCLKAAESGYDIYDVVKQGFSFPSGHTSCIASLVFGIYLYTKNKKLLYCLSPLIVFVGVSRFALGVHYPSDVIAGALIGILGSYLIDLCYRKMEKKVFYLCLCLLSFCGVFFCRSEDFYSVSGIAYGFILGDLYENKYVHFENTTDIKKMILRGIFGSIIFLGLNQVLDLLSLLIPDTAGRLPLLYRSFRYCLSSFVTVGLYPHLFKNEFLK